MVDISYDSDDDSVQSAIERQPPKPKPKKPVLRSVGDATSRDGLPGKANRGGEHETEMGGDVRQAFTAVPATAPKRKRNISEQRREELRQRMHEVRALRAQKSDAQREELERLAAAKEKELRARMEKEAERIARRRLLEAKPADPIEEPALRKSSGSTGPIKQKAEARKPKKPIRVVLSESEEEEPEDSSSDEEIVIRRKKRTKPRDEEYEPVAKAKPRPAPKPQTKRPPAVQQTEPVYASPMYQIF